MVVGVDKNEDNSSEVSSGLRHRLSVAQVNRLKQFKMEDLLDEELLMCF